MCDGARWPSVTISSLARRWLSRRSSMSRFKWRPALASGENIWLSTVMRRWLTGSCWMYYFKLCFSCVCCVWCASLLPFLLNSSFWALNLDLSGVLDKDLRPSRLLLYFFWPKAFAMYLFEIFLYRSRNCSTDWMLSSRKGGGSFWRAWGAWSATLVYWVLSDLEFELPIWK